MTSNWFSEIKSNLLIFILYTILTILMLFLINPIDITKTYFGHVEVPMWSQYFWWVDYAISNSLNPLYNNFIFYPVGLDLPDSIFPLFLFAPITHLFGSTVSYNLYVLTSFFFAGYGMFLLSNYLLKDRYIAFIVGIIFAFFPFHFGAAMGHVHSFSIMWIPFFVLFFIKMCKGPSYINIILSSLFFAINALSSWTISIMLVIFCIIFIIVFWKKCLTLSFFKTLFYFGSLSILLISPGLFLIIKGILNNPYMVSEGYNTYSADLLAFFIPSPLHPFFGNFTQAIYNNFTGNYSENIVFIGYSVLILAFFGILTARKTKYGQLLLLCFIVFLLFSFGPYLHINGQWIFLHNISIPLFGFLNEIPVFNMIRAPSRYDIMIMFSISLLSGFGIQYILNKLNLCRKDKKTLILSFISVIILIEFFAVIPVQDIKQAPQYYYSLNNGNVNPILEIPVIRSPIDPSWPSGASTMNLYYDYQKIHERPIMGGYFNRVNPIYEKFMKHDPLLYYLYAGRPYHNQTMPYDPLVYLAFKYNTSHIIIHKNLINQNLLDSYLLTFGNNYTIDNSIESDKLIIYDLTSILEKNDSSEYDKIINYSTNTYLAGSNIIFTKNGTLQQYYPIGWCDEETNFTLTNGLISSVSLYIENCSKISRLSLITKAYTGGSLKNQSYQVIINEKELTNLINVDHNIQNTEIPIPNGFLVNGTNNFTLFLPNATSPKMLGISDDKRKLGLAVYSINLT